MTEIHVIITQKTGSKPHFLDFKHFSEKKHDRESVGTSGFIPTNYSCYTIVI